MKQSFKGFLFFWESFHAIHKRPICLFAFTFYSFRYASGIAKISCKEKQMPLIHDYSERGLVNALFEELVASPDANVILAELLQSMTLWENRYSVCRFQLPDDIEDFEVFIEPSLSQFGSPDVVLFISLKNGGQAAFYIEAKLESFLKSSPPPSDDSPYKPGMYEKNASTILHEHYMKARFHDLLTRPEQQGLLHDGVRLYKRDRTKRRIGTDPVVLDLVNRLSQHGLAYFVSLTTDLSPLPTKASSEVWKVGTDVSNQIVHIWDTNKDADPNLLKGSVKGYWYELAYLMSWMDVMEVATKWKLARLERSLCHNESKLHFPQPEKHQRDECWRKLESWLDSHGVTWKRPPRDSNRKTIYVGKKGFVTCRIFTGFGGVEGFDLYPVQDPVRKALETDGLPEKMRVPVSEIDSRLGAGFGWLKRVLQLHLDG
jgi:hypothetical protein